MRRDICNIIVVVVIIIIRYSYIRVFLRGDVITIEGKKKKNNTNIVAIIT